MRLECELVLNLLGQILCTTLMVNQDESHVVATVNSDEQI